MRNNSPLNTPRTPTILRSLQGVDQKIRSGLRRISTNPHVQQYSHALRQRLQNVGIVPAQRPQTQSQHPSPPPHVPTALPHLADQLPTMPELSIVIVRANGLNELAQHQADNALEVTDDHYQGLQGIVRQVADSFRRPLRRAAAVVQARSNMVNNQNIFGDPARQAEHDREMEALRLRFSLGGSDHVFQDLAQNPESREEIPAHAMDPRRVQILALLETALVTGMSETAFRQQQQDLYRRLGLVDQQSVMTDNLWSLVQALRPDPNCLTRLQELKIVLGEAQIGLRTQTKYSLADRALHRLESVPFLNMVSPAVVATGVALATAVTISSAKGLLAVGAPVVGSAAVSGLAGYIQTHESTQRDVFNDRRDAAVREVFHNTSRERNRLQQAGTRFDMRDASDVTNQLSIELPDPVSLSSTQGFADACRAYRDLLLQYAEARARLGLSNRQRIDLIRFSSATSIEAERLLLTVAVARARETLRSYHAHLMHAAGGNLALSPQGVQFGLSNDPVTLINTQVAFVESDIQSRVIDTVQRSTRRFVRQKSLKSAALAAGSSVAFAGLTYGISQAFHGIFQPDGNLKSVSDTIIVPGSKSEVHLLGGEILEKNADGSWRIEQGNQVKVQGIRFNQDGTLTETSKTLLEEKGYFAHDKATWTETIASTVTERVTPEEYLSKYGENMVEIDHIEWADNNTPVFDKNELRLDWGGPNNSGITENGYVFSTQRMTPDGSYHGSETFDATVKDKLYNVFSVTRGTETKVFVFPDGAEIPKDSDAGKLLFREVNGKAVFLGNYAHAMYFDTPPVPGQTIPRGVSLATHVGTNTPNTVEKVVTTTSEVVHAPKVSIIPPLTASGEQGQFVVPLPLFLRRELERPHRSSSSHRSSVPTSSSYTYTGRTSRRPHTYQAPTVRSGSSSSYTSHRTSSAPQYSHTSLHPLMVAHAAMAGGTNTAAPFQPLFSNTFTTGGYGAPTSPYVFAGFFDSNADDDGDTVTTTSPTPPVTPKASSTKKRPSPPKKSKRHGATAGKTTASYVHPWAKNSQHNTSNSPLHTVVASLRQAESTALPRDAERIHNYLAYYACVEQILADRAKQLNKTTLSLDELQKQYGDTTIELSAIPSSFRRKVQRAWIQAQVRTTRGRISRLQLEAFGQTKHIPLWFFIQEYIQTGDELFNLRLDIAKEQEVVWPNINTAFDSREKLKNADKIVLLANRAIGDSVLMLPLLTGLNQFYALNNLPKKTVHIYVGSATLEIARSVAAACSHLDVHVYPHPGDLHSQEQADSFAREHIGQNDFFFPAGFDLKFSKSVLPKATVYMNYHTFDDYVVRSYISGYTQEKHSLGLPANTLRFLERLTGQKLFSHPKHVKTYINVKDHPEFDYLHRSRVLKTYEIDKDDEVLLISAGSAVRAKEYPPKQLAEMVEIVLKDLQKKRLRGESHRMPKVVLLPHEKNDEYAKELLALKKRLSRKYKVLADQISVGNAVEPIKNIMYLIDRAKVMFTPDTGLGHLASLMGTKNVMPTLSDPAFWSGPNTRAVWHEKAMEIFKSPEKARLEAKLWNGADAEEFSVYDDVLGKRIGAKDFPPEVLAKILSYHMTKP